MCYVGVHGKYRASVLGESRAVLNVSAAAHDAGSSIAVIAGEQALSFDELLQRVLQLAVKLNRLCTNQAQPVAFVAYPTLDSLLLLYALFELGHPALPLNPRLLPSDHEALVDHVGAIEVSFAAQDLIVSRQPNRPWYSPRLRLASILVATSGSTGRAKLVQLSEKALIAAAESSAERLHWKKDDRWLLSLSLCHIGGLSVATRCLLARIPVVLGDPRGGPAEFARLIHHHEVTMVSLVSTQLHRLLAGDHRLRGSKLRVMLLGAMHGDPWLVAAARTNGIPVLTTYGMTETASQIATQLLSDLRSLIGPCHDVGPPLENVELKIVNDEIVVRGPMLFDGYADDLAPTASQSAPLSTHGPASVVPKLTQGWFHTGDWGGIDGRNRLTVVGRASDRIVTSGESVAPAEVERVLETLPAIERACVFGMPDPIRGEQVVAALILREGTKFDLDDLEAQLSQRLASFKRPLSIALVSEFVMTATGKLDRAGTARMAASRLQVLPPVSA
jgi:o-succinylbenzoate---CoA ligase